MIKTFKDLIVWQEAMNLVEMIYLQTKTFPKEEMYGLTSQIRRAAVSIPTNIAEGNGRRSRKEYLRFLSIANGSIKELETHLLIVERLNFLPKEISEQMQTQLQSVGRLLTALRKSLRKGIGITD
ncbi:MAG: four helix bundle protein [Treponema sp.]|nr:four helix bundle protein [Treponema sp.]